MSYTVPFQKLEITRADLLAVTEALQNGAIRGGGPIGQELAARLSALHVGAHVIPTTSCSHALELAVMALQVRPGDEVIMPSFFFPSGANAVMRQGGIPVFADIEEKTFNIDPTHCASLITSRTVGVIVMHYGGAPCKLDAFIELTSRHHLWLIEDNAHGLGSSWNGRPLGTIGTIGCLSFHATKNLTCGEGGALLTKSAYLAAQCEVVAEKGTNRSSFQRREIDRYTWCDVGSSFLLSDVLAALMLAQLDRLESVTSKRQRLWQRYVEGLQDLDARGLIRCPLQNLGATHNAHCFAVLVDPRNREEILKGLQQRGVEATSHFEPLHSSPCAKNILFHSKPPPSLPVTDHVARGIIRLPIYPMLSDDAQDWVIRSVNEVVTSFARDSSLKEHRLGYP